MSKSDLIAEAYQVVAILAQRWPKDDPDIIRALDVLAAGEGSILPFAPVMDGAEQAGRLADAYYQGYVAAMVEKGDTPSAE